MEALPKESELASRIRTMADRLTRVRQAPVVDRYNGPVLFEGAAGAEAFSQVFVPKLLAMRTPASDNPQMEAYAAQNVSKLQDRLGSRVLPRFMSVVDDPTQTSYQGTPLVGSHAVDDEGVRARAHHSGRQRLSQDAAQLPRSRFRHSPKHGKLSHLWRSAQQLDGHGHGGDERAGVERTCCSAW